MITDKLQRITFGKYRNKTVYWVMRNDPHYLLWTYYNIPTVNYSNEILIETNQIIKTKI